MAVIGEVGNDLSFSVSDGVFAVDSSSEIQLGEALSASNVWLVKI